MDRASDNGVLGHLVGMSALQQDNPSAFILPGVELRSASLGKREADLLALVDGEIGMGEAKTSARLFTEQQIEKDLALAEALNAVVYLMVCLEPIDAGIKQTAARWCTEKGLRLLCLEGPAAPFVRLT
jgi:hypothetical protein